MHSAAVLAFSAPSAAAVQSGPRSRQQRAACNSGPQPAARSTTQHQRRVAAAALPPLPPLVPVPVPAPQPQDTDPVVARIETAFQDTFWGVLAAPRVLESFKALQTGRELYRQLPDLGLQHANSFLEGLSATPFPDLHSGAYKWLEAVESAAALIKQEFDEVTSDADSLQRRGNNIWVPAVREEAAAYGPDWRTLVLQDRGRWEPINSRLFPRTTKLFQDLQAPTLEVFFARQVAGTGIKSHTDYVNFIQTSHLGLDVPEGDCWIKVGEHTRKWENGKVIVCDTSFMHETANNTEHDRVVLIMRHFHPEVTPLERVALRFLFDCLDDPSPEGIKAAQKAAAAAAPGGGGKKGKKKGKVPSRSGGGGFGGFGSKA